MASKKRKSTTVVDLNNASKKSKEELIAELIVIGVNAPDKFCQKLLQALLNCNRHAIPAINMQSNDNTEVNDNISNNTIQELSANVKSLTEIVKSQRSILKTVADLQKNAPGSALSCNQSQISSSVIETTQGNSDSMKVSAVCVGRAINTCGVCGSSLLSTEMCYLSDTSQGKSYHFQQKRILTTPYCMPQSSVDIDPYGRPKLFHKGKEICNYISLLSKYVTSRKLNGATGNDSLLVDSSNFALRRTLFIDEMKAILAHLGLNADSYSGHSFRIGRATTCSSNGIQDHMIQTLGRLKSEHLKLTFVNASSAENVQIITIH
ncbi:unnamed protein product [Mytilus coruscus]|uniref:Tyr recombinase domain-containing protein n=1 Tax=Mytilus coruscus TaxID=42192 RepID=A0A6J8DS77_MYTCO|nr:unnamed protein product [Mytilus coruscus]